MTIRSVGYDPERVHTLGRRTSDAIRALDAIRSDDPAAADAMRVVRLTRQTLADHWMPLIREIETSTSMTTWHAHPVNRLELAGRRAVAWLQHRPDADADRVDRRGADVEAIEAFRRVLARLTDRELLERIDEMCERQVRAGLAVDADDFHPDDPHWVALLSALAIELDRRLAVDGDGRLRRALFDALPRSPLIALALPYSLRLPPMAASMALAMLHVDGWERELRPGLYERGVETLLRSLAASPPDCLDLLLDDTVLANLAGWTTLDADVVERFVWSGLYTSVAEAPARLTDGYAVLRSLTRLANEHLDGGFAPGMARAVAASMLGYVDTLAPSVRFEHDGPVTIHLFEPPASIRLGTYDDVVDLFGALARDEIAQASLGLTLGAYTEHVVADLGAHVHEYVGIEYVTRFADLIGDAVRSERAESVLVAAHDLARQQRMGSLVTFGVSVALGPSGTFGGHVARSFARSALDAAGMLGAAPPDRVPDLSIPAAVHRDITVAVLDQLVRTPALRVGDLLERVTDDEWALVGEHLDDVADAGDDPVERADRVDRMERFIERTIPALGGYLRTVRSAPNFDELEEDRAAARADDDR